MNLDSIYYQEKIKELILLKKKHNKMFLLLFLISVVILWLFAINLYSFNLMVASSFFSFVLLDQLYSFVTKKK
jgi:hypothetical protein